MSKFTLAEYIWMDGAVPTRHLRSKARAVEVGSNPTIEDFPEWSFDGSSTNQATGSDSDCILRPATFIADPFRGDGNYLVMAEVLNPDGSMHESNSRAQLRTILDAGAAEQEPWAGFEQEYTMFAGRQPLGWPDTGFPGPQGPYYCGIGADEAFGRDIVEKHARMCLDVGLLYYGLNAEVMPGQWEFQIGYRGSSKEAVDVLTVSDHVWFARWLLYRVAENHGVTISTHNKPIEGDWNGAGMHTNFSTKATRDKKSGMKAIEDACEALSKKHQEHIKVYGYALERRLTGKHETCDIDTFKAGTADRGCSIRIPQLVAQKGYGYLEDRRPGSNADPYLVSARISATVCGVDESLMKFTEWPRKDNKFALAAAS